MTMQTAVPLACFLSLIRPPGIQYENSLLQIVPVNKFKCPYVKNGNDVGFQLFTRHNPTVYQELAIDDDEKLFASNIDFNDKTMLYFHGWMEQPEDGSAVMVREAYMQRGDTNVIMVDAHHLEAGPWYFTAAQNTWYIGRFAAQFIDYLVSRGLNLNNTHLIGHSLGAHIAGVASSSLKAGRVARLTALDPALPLFEHLPLEQRLDPSDAHFIDVIHTDAGIFGYKYPTGHADFYPNGGISPQPGCELEVVIPQQQLLNKCDGRTQTRGFYAYYLTNQKPIVKTKSLESKIENLFNFIHSVKAKGLENGEKNETKSVNISSKVNEHSLTVVLSDKQKFIDRRDNVNDPTRDDSKDKEEVIENREEKTEERDKKMEEYEDQIAEASELVETRVEFNQETLKEKETETLIRESSESVLENAKTTDIKKPNEDYQSTKPINETTDTIVKKDTNRFNLLTEPISDTTNKKEREIKVKELNYKDPCDDYIIKNTLTTVSYDVETTETPINNVGKIENKEKPKLNVNVLDLIGTTYRIGRILSAFHQHKRDKSIFDKLKSAFLKSTTTTPRSILNQIKLKTLISPKKNRIVKRQKRFLPFLKKSEDGNDSNMLVKVLEFLVKNRKNVVPVFMVMREINTLVKSSNGELNHNSKEQNSYIGGATPPVFEPISYTLELGNENKVMAFIKRLVGIPPKGDRLTIGSGK